MKSVLLLVVIAVSLTAIMARDGDVFDKMDVKAILKSRDALLRVFNCLMDRVPCEELQGIRDKIPKILKTRCADCTPAQKSKYNELKTRLRTEHPATYNQLLAKYAKSR